ncbi:MAG: hypothetical protein BIFFINMI_00567 [Phycisphaerae bacterium]|nr:hypothetical protein [Phycisphaerae bacterium]
MSKRSTSLAVTLTLGMLTIATALMTPAPARADEPLPGQGPSGGEDVGSLLFNVRHYISLSQYKLATVFIDALLAKNADPQSVIEAIRNDPKILGDATGGVEAQLAKAAELDAKTQEQQALKAAAIKLQQFIERGHREAQRDPVAITEDIKLLVTSTMRTREKAIERLREKAPWCVPQMLDELRGVDPVKADERALVAEALPQMGRAAVEPLIAALDTPGEIPLKITVVKALLSIGYPHAVPYLQALVESTPSADLKNLSAQIVTQLAGVSREPFTGSAGEMFSQLGDRYYSDQASLRPQAQNAEKTPVWYFKQGQGVTAKLVASDVYNEVMAMRCFRRALDLQSDQPMAVALWIAANIRREAQLPPGETPEKPDANYYAVAAGPRYCLMALQRAMTDRDSEVAFGLARALSQVGFSNSAMPEATVLATALQFPDRRVRYEIALAMAASRCQSQLPGAEMVVPTLSQSLHQTGMQYALVLEQKENGNAALVTELRKAGFQVYVAPTRQKLLDLAHGWSIPNVDVVVVNYEQSEGGRAGLLAIRQDHRFANVPTLVVAQGVETAKIALKDVPFTGVVAPDAQAAELNAEIVRLQSAVGGQPLTADEAKDYALHAARALRDLARVPTPGMDVAVAMPGLKFALADARLDVASAAAEALSYFRDQEVQRALASAALDAKADPARRVVMFQQLAASAKGDVNRLTADQVEAVTKVATSEPDTNVRSAAALALGALGLGPGQVNGLIKTSSSF